MAVASAPLSVSPAPTVSTASTRGAWMARARRPPTSSAPEAPSVTRTARKPGSGPSSRLARADGLPSDPARTESSPSFGVRTSARASVGPASPVAGAGLRMVVAPAMRPSRSASCVAPVRISWPTRMTSSFVGLRRLNAGPDLDRGERRVRAAGHRDAVLAGLVDEDQGDAGRLALEAQELADVDALGFERSARVAAEAIAADRPDEDGRGA